MRHPAQKMLLASAAPTGEILMQTGEPQESEASEIPESSDQPALSGAELEAALAEREQIGYLRGRAEAVEACWIDPASPSQESLEIMARMGIGLDDPKASPFAGRKSVWGPSN